MDPLILIPITVVFVAAMIIGRNIVVRRKLICPRTGTPANVDVVQRSLNPDKMVRVTSCDQLPDPNVVDCDQGCIHPEEHHVESEQR